MSRLPLPLAKRAGRSGAFVILALAALALLAWPAAPEAWARGGYMGHAERKGCTKCHKEQYEAWLKTPHAKAMETLLPGQKVEAKQKAKLDPKKDYTSDSKCLRCHTTGFGEGGYVSGNRRKADSFANVGCESCHGAGQGYMEVKQKYPNDDFPRIEVAAAGLLYGEAKQCEECHNKDGPTVQNGYVFDYRDLVKKGTHKHFRQKHHEPRQESAWLYEKS